MGMQNYKTQGMPNLLNVRPRNDVEKTYMEGSKLFWSRMGMLLYIVKHSRPDIAYAVRELSKVIDSANKAAILEMHHVLNMCWTPKIFDWRSKQMEKRMNCGISLFSVTVIIQRIQIPEKVWVIFFCIF